MMLLAAWDGHDGSGAEEAIRRALKMGFKVNIEFIFGYPGQTWIPGFRPYTGDGFGVQEIQVYRLEVLPIGPARSSFEE